MSGQDLLEDTGADRNRYKEAFIDEAEELLRSLNESALELERKPDDKARIDEIFRAAHSLKGMSATMGYEGPAGLTHRMENLLDLVRQGRLAISEDFTSTAFDWLDALGAALAAIRADRPEPDTAAILAKLARFDPDSPPPAPPGPRLYQALMEPAPEPGGTPRYRVAVALEENCALKSVRAYMVVKRLSHIGHILESVPSLEDLEDEKFADRFEFEFSCPLETERVKADIEAVSEVAGVEVTEIAAAPKSQPPLRPNESQTVRISLRHLDNLVNLVGELVITRSRLEELGAGIVDPGFEETIQTLRRLTGDLQYEVMRTRMVPVENIFNRFPRMVRDTAKTLRKEVEFVVTGGDIELDRTVLDEVGDPIVHLLRNAVGHGIEGPADRVAAGKPERGRIRLNAAREKEAVIIEVTDDGRGLDVERLRQKAVGDGLMTETEAAVLGDRETVELICRPGFSTAETTGELSGRGVGLDAVKGKIEALGGTLSIASEPGKGSTFTLELPLTLAIIQALMVRAAGQTYALPLSSVVEVSSVRDDQIEGVKEAWTMVLRDHTVPLVWLAEEMGARIDPPGRLDERPVAVVRHGREVRGLVVERLLGRSEIVVKPLTSFFDARPGVGGVTILGDGRPALVIDVRTLN